MEAAQFSIATCHWSITVDFRVTSSTRWNDFLCVLLLCYSDLLREESAPITEACQMIIYNCTIEKPDRMWVNNSESLFMWAVSTCAASPQPFVCKLTWYKLSIICSALQAMLRLVDNSLLTIRKPAHSHYYLTLYCN